MNDLVLRNEGEEKTIISLVNISIEEICGLLKYKNFEKNKLRKSFWDIYLGQVTATISRKSNNFHEEEKMINTLEKLGKITREKYLDPQTNIDLILSTFFRYVDIFMGHAGSVVKKEIADVVIKNFQLINTPP